MNPKCVICMDDIPDHLIDPCNHLCLCSSCAKQSLKECPICRRSVNKFIKIFFAGIVEDTNKSADHASTLHQQALTSKSLEVSYYMKGDPFQGYAERISLAFRGKQSSLMFEKHKERYYV